MPLDFIVIILIKAHVFLAPAMVHSPQQGESPDSGGKTAAIFSPLIVTVTEEQPDDTPTHQDKADHLSSRENTQQTTTASLTGQESTDSALPSNKVGHAPLMNNYD